MTNRREAFGRLLKLGALLVALHPGTTFSQASGGDMGARERTISIEAADAARKRQDFSEAARIYKLLADRGDAEAQVSLGELYEEGDGVSQDYSIAMTWYRKAAEQGLARAQNALGRIYDVQVGPNRHPTRVPQDSFAAATWYRKAADQGYGPAMLSLAELLRGMSVGKSMGLPLPNGFSPSVDYAAESLSWVMKAANAGYPFAQLQLANMYLKGDQVPQDFVRAHMWFNLLAAGTALRFDYVGRHLQSQAVDARNSLEKRMTSGQIEAAQRAASEWQKR